MLGRAERSADERRDVNHPEEVLSDPKTSEPARISIRLREVDLGRCHGRQGVKLLRALLEIRIVWKRCPLARGPARAIGLPDQH
jgi:hypothetical protein